MSKLKVTVAQWIVSYHPAGKTSRESPLNLPGRFGWFLMEIIGPVNLLAILYTQLDGDLAALPTTGSKLATALYVLHYANRAVISPFVSAPSMSPIHAFIVSSAMMFNWFNSVCLAGWVLGFPLDIALGLGSGSGSGSEPGAVLQASTVAQAQAQAQGTGQTWLLGGGLAMFFIGMIGNIYSERTLFRLRREEGDKQASSSAGSKGSSSSSSGGGNEKKKNKYSRVYVIPPKQGVFKTILYPHFAFEWIEWLGYALVGTAVFPVGTGSLVATTAPRITLVPWLVPAARLAQSLQVPLPLPAVVFVVNAVTNMLPHARWGRKWYVEKFGEERVGNRGAAVPWCPWL